MSYETILYEVADRVATITLNRPDAMNALTDQVVAELHEATWRADADREARVIILTGAGRAFCAGGDINGFGGVDPKALLRKLPRHFDIDARPDYQSRHTYFPRIRKPIIGMINGACAGLGTIYALCCDVRFASESAVFTTAFARLGLSAEYGMAWMLARVVGHANALDLLLSARRVVAPEAKELGLVNKVFPAGELERETRAYAQDLAIMVRAALDDADQAAALGSAVPDAARGRAHGQRPDADDERLRRFQGGRGGLQGEAAAGVQGHRGPRMTLPNEMEALIVRRYGDWRAVDTGRLPVPRPGPGQVLIRAGAAALNFPDLLMIEGKYQVKPELPFVPGRDVAGTVVALGEGARGFAPGDRVAAQPPSGAFGEYVAAPDYTCVQVPTSVSDADAAACGTVIATVVGAMRLRARLRPGETVLVTGAAGGVGSMGLQYARHLGARPVALVSSDAKEAAARRLGADVVLRSDRIGEMRKGLRTALSDAGLEHVDAVVDMVGGATADAALRCLRPGGRFVIVGFASGEIPQIPANYLLLKDLVVLGSSLDRLFRERDLDLAEGMADAFAALGDTRLHSEIDSRLPLAEFATGAGRIANRKAIGKVVFELGGPS